MSDRPPSPYSSSSTPSLTTSRDSSCSDSSFPSSPKQLGSATLLEKKPRPPSLSAYSQDSPVFFSDFPSDELPLSAIPDDVSLREAIQRPVRPPLMPRQSSYSKRHASFDTPREVPMPSDLASSPVDKHHHTSQQLNWRPPPSNANSSGSSTTVTPEMLLSREPSDYSNPPVVSPKPTQFFLADRSSTASLLLPSSTPYSYLPTLADTSEAIGKHKATPPPDAPSPNNETARQLERQKKSQATAPMSQPPRSPSPPRPPPLTQRHSDSADPNQMNMSPPPVIPAVSASIGKYKVKDDNFKLAPFPPPDPPHIHPPLSPKTLERSASQRSSAHDSFLPHEIAPINGNAIAVETHKTEYKLHVNLPGYKRDCITLATRRRRILHVMANSWEQGGGHFDRRISFGYDADLSQVRAEFDGDILRVIVPRRSLHPWRT